MHETNTHPTKSGNTIATFRDCSMHVSPQYKSRNVPIHDAMRYFTAHWKA